MEKLLKLLDYVFMPLAIVALCYNPFYSSGQLLHLEAGQYLGTINAIWHGMAPYRDVFVVYGPLGIYLPMVLLQVFEPTLETLRAYFHIGSILTVVITYFLALPLIRGRLFRVAASLLLVLDTFSFYWSNRWGGIRGGLGALVLILLFTSHQIRFPRSARCLAGFLCAVGLMYSIEIGVFASLASVMYLAAFARAEGIGPKGFLSECALPFLAGLISSLAIPIIIMAYYNILSDYVRTTFVDVPAAFASWRIPVRALGPDIFLLEALPAYIFSLKFKAWLVGLLYAGTMTYFGLLARKRLLWTDYNAKLIALTAYGGLLWLGAFRSIVGPQLGMALGPAIIIAMIFLQKLWERLREIAVTHPRSTYGFWYGPRIACIGILLVSTFYMLLSQKVRVVGSPPAAVPMIYQLLTEHKGTDPLDRSSVKTVRFKFDRVGDVQMYGVQADLIRNVTQYLKAHTSPDEPVFVFPDMGAYYFFADRPSVGRFPVPLVAHGTERLRLELLNAVKANPPRYIVYDRAPSLHSLSIGKPDRFLLPELDSFIWDNYDVEKQFGLTWILKRKDEAFESLHP